MTQFQYKARDTKGAVVAGVVAAESMAQAGAMLRAEGKYVVKLNEAQASIDLQEDAMTLEQHGRRVKRDEVIYFAHQMAIMLETGVPIGDALQVVTDQTANPHFHAVLDDVCTHVQGGGALSAAFHRHARVFPNIMTSLMKASEVSGQMGQMLDRICRYLHKEQLTIRKIRGALMYPAFMAVMAFGVTAFLLMFVMPRFAAIYAEKGATLPLPTKLLMNLSSFMVGYWWLWTGAIAIVTGFLLWFRTTPIGGRFFDWFKLRCPVIGAMYQQLYLTRAMQTMGTMCTAGVPMLDMIAITRQVTNNLYFQELWDEVDERVRHGSQLSEPMFASELVPKSIACMVASGEKAGRLAPVLIRVAEFTEQDFDESVKRATQFIEPLMMTVMGVIIGGVAISLLLPIFSIGQVMAGK